MKEKLEVNFSSKYRTLIVYFSNKLKNVKIMENVIMYIFRSGQYVRNRIYDVDKVLRFVSENQRSAGMYSNI